jgi:hypothetical protein
MLQVILNFFTSNDIDDFQMLSEKFLLQIIITILHKILK